jgi:hypothetical protein
MDTNVLLPVHVARFSASDQDDTYQGVPVYGEDIDVNALVKEVAEIWAPAGVVVTLQRVHDWHLVVAPSANPRNAIEQSLKRHTEFTDLLKGAQADRAAVVALISVFDRFGLTYTAWERPETDPATLKAAIQKLAGFTAPFVIIAVAGAVESTPGQWTTRSTDTTAFGLARSGPAQDAFHLASVASDVAHELGHLLSLPHVKEMTGVDQAASQLFRQLMYPRVVAPRARAQAVLQSSDFSGLPRGSAVGTLELGALSTGLTANADTQKLIVSGIQEVSLRRLGTGAYLVLDNRQVAQIVRLSQGVTQASRNTELHVEHFKPIADYPLASSLLHVVSEWQTCLRGAAISDTFAVYTRSHVQQGLAFASK